MVSETLKEKIHEQIDNLDWEDSAVPDIMEGFFYSPSEAIDCSKGEISDAHYEHLAELLNIEESDEDDRE